MTGDTNAAGDASIAGAAASPAAASPVAASTATSVAPTTPAVASPTDVVAVGVPSGWRVDDLTSLVVPGSDHRALAVTVQAAP